MNRSPVKFASPLGDEVRKKVIFEEDGPIAIEISEDPCVFIIIDLM
jgi:hypothetical protein